jgi:hypothetical protein
MKMKILLMTAIVFAASCKKESVEKPNTLPELDMSYIDLSGKEIGPGQFIFIDLNNDKRKDVGFSTLLVGDPIEKQDKLQYLVSSDILTSLPVNDEESTRACSKNEVIPIGNFSDHNWYNASAVVLAQKITLLGGDSFWVGKWKDIQHKYLPVQVLVNNKRYNGWVELSFNTETQKIILHKAAISRKAEIEVKAGV